MQAFRRVVATASAVLSLIAAPIGRTANGPDVGDLWWNPTESGWGMQLVQNGTTLFATMFVYHETTFPFWYVATLYFQGDDPITGGPTYTGDLFETRGPYFGTVPFNPTQVTVAKVGTMTFTNPTVGTGTLAYSVYGLTVNKNLQRQTIATENYNGTYLGVYAVERYGCPNPANNGKSVLLTTFSVTQSPASMLIGATITAGIDIFTCNFNGSYSQIGRMASSHASYVCSTGENGSVDFFEMTRERLGIISRLRGTDNLGCSLRGGLSALD